MNPSFFYATLFIAFSIFDYAFGSGFSIKVDLGIALIFLGIGLNRLRKNEGETKNL